MSKAEGKGEQHTEAEKLFQAEIGIGGEEAGRGILSKDYCCVSNVAAIGLIEPGDSLYVGDKWAAIRKSSVAQKGLVIYDGEKEYSFFGPAIAALAPLQDKDPPIPFTTIDCKFSLMRTGSFVPAKELFNIFQKANGRKGKWVDGEFLLWDNLKSTLKPSVNDVAKLAVTGPRNDWRMFRARYDGKVIYINKEWVLNISDDSLIYAVENEWPGSCGLGYLHNHRHEYGLYGYQHGGGIYAIDPDYEACLIAENLAQFTRGQMRIPRHFPPI